MEIANPHIFKEYDIRGIVENDFSEPLIKGLGKAFGTYVSRQSGKRNPVIAVGRDVRLTGPRLFDWITAGLLETGATVTNIGECPTPVTYFSLFHLPLDGAVMITGSHNPKEYNGFKLCYNKTTLFGKQIQDIRGMVETDDFQAGSGKRDEYKILKAYEQHHLKRHSALSKRQKPLKVVVDAGNGTAGLIMPALLRGLGCNLVELFCSIDGNFPNHHPDPTIPENLEKLVQTVLHEKADLGLAFDGDADRLGIVDETGRILWGDEIMVVLARDILKRHPKAKIIGEVKCSQRMYDAIGKAGGDPIMWKTGHSLIKNKMKAEHALLAGEMSGHLFLAENYFGYDDAIHAGLEVCRILGDHLDSGGKGLSQFLSDLPEVVATPEIRTDCSDAEKFEIVERTRKTLEDHLAKKHPPKIKSLITIDGVRAVFEKGWGLVRASNTQPILVSRYEAMDRENLETYQQFMQTIIANAVKGHHGWHGY